MTKKTPKNPSMTMITVVIIPDIGGWPVDPVAATFARSFGIRNAMAISITIPITSQLHEKISNNARAQRRALMEPIPSHTRATAITPYSGLGAQPTGCERLTGRPPNIPKGTDMPPPGHEKETGDYPQWKSSRVGLRLSGGGPEKRIRPRFAQGFYLRYAPIQQSPKVSVVSVVSVRR